MGAPTLYDRAARLRLLLFDVDGVLTDGAVYLDGRGEYKRFSIRDGTAIVLAHRAGLLTGVLSARWSAATEQRATQLRMAVISQGVADKADAFEAILREQGLTVEEVAFMGDDLLDLPVLTRVGLSAAPADAAPEVIGRVDFAAPSPGGHGAVRDFITFVLKAQGRWDEVLATLSTGEGTTA
ncbi:MAG: HAD hydrolase family protein [Vicinamibacteraceae bacterium]|nr:HAD hydrolase family protein [Vicinamibacteraceae bacterium]